MGTGAWLPGVSAAASPESPSSPASSPSLSPSPSSSSPDLSRFYTQKIKWGACEGDGAGLLSESDATAVPKDKNVQCGKITVPLDYAKPSRGKVEVAMVRIKSSGKPRGSLLINFGGPGGAGVSGLLHAQKEFEYLGKGYDVVSFDPRGVGESSPVSCGEDGAQEPEMEGGPEDPAAVLDEMRKINEQCEKESGPVLPYVGTVNVSRDMDVMRQVLGDKKLNYLGFSYGTRLGAVYTAQFPKKVGRMVLDGVDTLTEDVEEQALVSAEGRQTALDNFIKWCTGNAGCVLGTDSRAARDNMSELIKGLDTYPLQSSDGAEFTGQDVVDVLGQALYSRQSWPALSQALGALLADGDPRALLRMSGSLAQQAPGDGVQGLAGVGGLAGVAGLAGRAPEDIPADNMAAALMAVNCADDPDRPDADSIEKEVTKLQEEFESTSAIFGRSMLMPVLFCFGRPAGTDYIRDEVRDVKSPDFLLVGTRGDPATPYRWTQETAERLGSAAVVLDNKGDGHTGYAGSKCVRDKVDGFLLYGEMPANGSSCGVDEEE
ncbi:alpha/beta hydrolase [Streptomyces durmitorensis]|uniref:Alpha/beta hydrolase n=2 Tax=Streptomyces durmitorensis TaxID=319947 RepID=A0ABY4Q5W7_9ACTN|nr:alpha/beta hydrolase [Streptomyces durmitorensis]UQT61583.1 alpha/beta hydrolase [Streptomyces durmitorensis]